jgi:NADPH-dependent 2,4-dienoyl-CoA reductase/sulfur reductase-like enzyme
VRVLVVGASLAGIKTVQGLRRLGSDARITVVDPQREVACDRPPLSKTFLADPAGLPRPLLSDDQLDELDVELVLGRAAVDLDTRSRTVGLQSGSRLSYDALVIACGSRPRTIPTLEVRDGVHLLRTAEHAAAIRARLVPGARLVIVGGGFIGAEVAWTARSLGVDVTVVEPLPTLLVRGLGPLLGEVFTRRHAASGVHLRLGVGVASIEGDERVEAVRLSDGTRVPADVVVIGVGTIPETDWLNGSGLELDDGVICDEHLAAVGVPDVYAAGDVARWLHPRYGERVRMEHWTNAVEQGGVVAANIGGVPTVYDAVPYVWSDQLGARLQVFGRVRPDDELRYVVGGPDDEKFVAVLGAEDQLHAVVGYGAVRELMPYRKLLVDGGSWSAALASATVVAS